jgi:hypothetical protein
MSKETVTLGVIDRKHGVAWNWYGGHYIHGIKDDKEMYLLSAGDMSKDSLTEEEALKAMRGLCRRKSIESYRVVP